MPNTTNFNWTTPADTDLVKDGALAIRTLANGIDTSLVDLKGGTTGQVLSKATNTDLDFQWVAQDDSNAIQNAIIDAKGDLIVGTAADTPARLAVGATDGHVLTIDASTASGLKWSAPAAGGKVLQIVQATYSTQTTIATTTMTDTGLSASITPSSTNSKVLIIVNQVLFYSRNANQLGVYARIMRDSTSVFGGTTSFFEYDRDGAQGVVERWSAFSAAYLDSPSTTSSTTYKTQGSLQTTDNSASSRWQPDGYTNNILLLEIGA